MLVQTSQTPDSPREFLPLAHSSTSNQRISQPKIQSSQLQYKQSTEQSLSPKAIPRKSNFNQTSGSRSRKTTWLNQPLPSYTSGNLFVIEPSEDVSSQISSYNGEVTNTMLLKSCKSLFHEETIMAQANQTLISEVFLTQQSNEMSSPMQQNKNIGARTSTLSGPEQFQTHLYSGYAMMSQKYNSFHTDGKRSKVNDKAEEKKADGSKVFNEECPVSFLMNNCQENQVKLLSQLKKSKFVGYPQVTFSRFEQITPKK